MLQKHCQQISREHQIRVQVLKLIMVLNFVVKVFQQQLQIHVLIEHVSKILQLKIIKIVIYGFHQMVIIKFVFGMALVVVLILNNVLHFKEPSIPVLSILQLMVLVKEIIPQYKPALLKFAIMLHLIIIQMLYVNNGGLLVWLMDKAVFQLDSAKILAPTQYVQLIR